MVGPLALVALVAQRRRKRGKRDELVDRLLVLAAVLLIVGTGLVACTPTPMPPPPTGNANTPPSTPAGGATATQGANPTATGTAVAPTPGQTPTTIPVCPTRHPLAVPQTAFITIDDGPGGLTDQVLSVLARHGVKATFFLTGNRIIGDWSDDVYRMQNEGHAIGVHSQTHPVRPGPNWNEIGAEKQKQEIADSQVALKNVLGRETDLFRAPGGFPSEEGVIPPALYNYGWTANTHDDSEADEKENLKKVESEITYGDGYMSNPIILMHSIFEQDERLAELLIGMPKEKGYDFGVLPRYPYCWDFPGTAVPITNGS